MNMSKEDSLNKTNYPYIPGWRKNYNENKPEIKHSVLLFTTHGIVEGEWLGDKWIQYRWSASLKDSEVLYWMHLCDLERLEKEGENESIEKDYFVSETMMEKDKIDTAFTKMMKKKRELRYCIDYINPKHPFLDNGKPNIRHYRISEKVGDEEAESILTIILSFDAKLVALYRGNILDGKLADWPIPMIVDEDDWVTEEWLSSLKLNSLQND